MHEDQWLFPLSESTPSLKWREPSLDRGPAPGGTLFVLGADGGCAAVPRERNVVSLGREQASVHVVVGGTDLGVSRRHATIRCGAQGRMTWWTLRNEGGLPIHLPQAPPLLQYQETPLDQGFTALYLGSDRLHAVEVLVSRGRDERPPVLSGPTRDGRVDLSPEERLVLVAMFRDYLDRSSCARPLTRNDTSDVLNEVPGQSGWTYKKVEHAVTGVRKKLSKTSRPGFDADSAHPEQLRVNLIDFLLNTGSLVPDDLRLIS